MPKGLDKSSQRKSVTLADWARKAPNNKIENAINQFLKRGIVNQEIRIPAYGAMMILTNGEHEKIANCFA
jgi:hypothetical protein